MNGLTRPSEARRRRVVVRPCWWVPLLIIPQRLDACAVCFGRSDSPLAEAMNMGILSLLVVIVGVLASCTGFFVYVARRSARLARTTGPSPVAPLAGPPRS